MLQRVSKTLLKKLRKAPPRSHKGENGVLVILGGSRRYHGALLLAATVASKIVDLVYVSSVPENLRLIRSVKSGLTECIAVPRKELRATVKGADALLLGPGLQEDIRTKRLVNRLLKETTIPVVLDAAAIKLANKTRLRENVVLTPHAAEFKALFGIPATSANVQRMARKYQCIIVRKGKEDIICSRGRCVQNATGDVGMTKGGTGDVLAGLLAALACTNDPFTAAQAAAWLNGRAGERLGKRLGRFYAAGDLIPEIQKLLHAFTRKNEE